MAAAPEGVLVLKEVAQLLETRDISYWLGRGRFRHFTLTHEFGNKESDIDLHVWREAERKLRAALPELELCGYTVTDNRSRHKLSVRKGSVAVEFVYLERVSDDPQTVYHETVYPARKRFMCPAHVFGDRRVDMFGASVRVPQEEYLPCVFGPQWRENQKGSGGVES